MAMMTDLMTQHVSQAEYERQHRIRTAWAYYHGHMRPPLRTLPGGVDDNILLGYAKLIVDKGVSFMVGQGVGIEVDGGNTDSGPENPTDAWATAFWRANRGTTTQQTLAINGGVCGHAFARLVPPRVPGGYPRVIVLDPANVTVICDPEDYEHVVRYVIQWSGVDPTNGQAIVRRQTISEDDAGRWTIRDEVSRGDTPGWLMLAEDLWPWAWCPVSECQNLLLPNVFWGQSDLETDVVQANDAINFAISNIGRVLRFHAHPKTWGSGFRADDLDTSPDSVISFPNPDASLHNLEMQSDMGSSIEYYVKLKEALHEVSRIPEIATGRVENVGALSGTALRILYQPLLEKTDDKRIRYGHVLEELTEHALEMAGYGAEHEIVLHWPNPLPADDFAEAQAAQAWKDVGVSRDTLLERAGYDPEAEREKRQADAEVAAATFQQAGGAMLAFNRGRIDPGNGAA